MAIIRYKAPLNLVTNLKHEMDKLFDSAYYGDSGEVGQALGSQWRPNVDIKESADKFVVYGDIPGVDAKDIKISLDGNTLTVSGERNLETHKDAGSYHRAERFSGSFCRQFTLPRNIDGSKIKAVSKKGVLEVTIPKVEAAATKYIDVKSED